MAEHHENVKMRLNQDFIKEAGLAVTETHGRDSFARRKAEIKRLCLERDFSERVVYEDAVEAEVLRLKGVDA